MISDSEKLGVAQSDPPWSAQLRSMTGGCRNYDAILWVFVMFWQFSGETLLSYRIPVDS